MNNPFDGGGFNPYGAPRGFGQLAPRQQPQQDNGLTEEERRRRQQTPLQTAIQSPQTPQPPEQAHTQVMPSMPDPGPGRYQAQVMPPFQERRVDPKTYEPRSNEYVNPDGTISHGGFAGPPGHLGGYGPGSIGYGQPGVPSPGTPIAPNTPQQPPAAPQVSQPAPTPAQRYAVMGYNQSKLDDLSYTKSPKYTLGRVQQAVDPASMLTPEGQQAFLAKLHAADPNGFYKDARIENDKLYYTGQHGQPVTLDIVNSFKTGDPSKMKWQYLTNDGPDAGHGGQPAMANPALGNAVGGNASDNIMNLINSGSTDARARLNQMLAMLTLKSGMYK